MFFSTVHLLLAFQTHSGRDEDQCSEAGCLGQWYGMTGTEIPPPENAWMHNETTILTQDIPHLRPQMLLPSEEEWETLTF